MGLRGKRSYKYIMWVLTLACLGGAGFLGYKTFFSSVSAAKDLNEAETAYARGSEAYQQEKWDAAATRFDEAKLLADKALESLKAQANEKKVTVEVATADPLRSIPLGSFTPSVVDPSRAAGIRPQAAAERIFRFTPSGKTGDRKALTLGLTSRVATPEAGTRADALRPVQTAYNVGASVGWLIGAVRVVRGSGDGCRDGYSGSSNGTRRTQTTMTIRENGTPTLTKSPKV